MVSSKPSRPVGSPRATVNGEPAHDATVDPGTGPAGTNRAGKNQARTTDSGTTDPGAAEPQSTRGRKLKRAAIWAGSVGLVAAEIATVLSSSKVDWYRWLCVSIVMFAVLVASRNLLERRLPHSVPDSATPDMQDRASADGRAWTWFVLGGMCVVLFAGLLKPPHRSDDVFAYGAYGRLVSEHSVSPYATRPSAFPDDPVIARMATGWRTTRSVYGPLFTVYSAVGMRIAGTSMRVERLWFQVLAAAATGMSALLLKRLSPRHWWMFALNPVTLVCVAHEGHNDALVGLGVLSALWFTRRAYEAKKTRGAESDHRMQTLAHFAAGTLVLAASIKITTILAAPALAVWIVATLGRKRSARIGAVWSIVCLGLFAATGGPSAFAAFRGLRTFRSTTSLWHLDFVRQLTDNSRGKPGPLALTLPAVALCLVGLLVVKRTYDAARPAANENPNSNCTYDFPRFVALTLLPLVTFISLGLYVLPWYWGWLLAPAILLPSTFRTAVLFASAAHTLAYGAGTQLYGTFATVLQTARFLAPLAFVVGVAIGLVVVIRTRDNVPVTPTL